MRSRIRILIPALVKVRQMIFMVGLLCAGYSQAEWFAKTESIMGTEVSVTLWDANTKDGQAAIDKVLSEMRRIDARFSPYIDTSELATLNRTAFKRKANLSLELSALVDKSLYFYKLTGGAFDITFASLARYYDYRKKVTPTKQQAELAQRGFSSRHLQFDKRHHTLRYANEFVQIDLGGIAKGYAVDRAITLLQDVGVQHATVSAGGDSRVLGDKLGAPWIVGIKNPRLLNEKDPQVVIKLPLVDMAISTSGDYERYFIDPTTGERIHHIINPATGKSASDVMSVTVIGPSGVDTDALSTSVFILGVQKGLALIDDLKAYDAIIIDADGKVHYSSGLENPN